jgi:hypothetical protein
LIDKGRIPWGALDGGERHFGILLDGLTGANQTGDGDGGRFDELEHARGKLLGVRLAEQCARGGRGLWLGRRIRLREEYCRGERSGRQK